MSKRDIIIELLTNFFISLILLTGESLIIMLCWNYFIPNMFYLVHITFGQAFVFNILIKTLLGNLFELDIAH